MAKDKKGKIFYEVTKEKPSGKTHVFLMGGSVGAVISFFIVSALGVFSTIGMDDLVFYFILSCLVGFLVGGFLTWVFVENFSKVVSGPSVSTPQPNDVKPVTPENPSGEPEANPDEADKGQSVDFVFPELSPDK